MIVVDASVALAWCFADEDDAYAEHILERVVAESAAAPAHWPLEVANGVRTAERRGRIQADDVSRIAQMLEGLSVEIVPIELSTALWSVLDLAREHDLSAYDAAYLGLARHRGMPVATLDANLRAACEAAGVELAA
ncbi:MAG: type II toxin-antitoxin system VapC family toxin [Chloroflexota bacterium]